MNSKNSHFSDAMLRDDFQNMSCLYCCGMYLSVGNGSFARCESLPLAMNTKIAQTIIDNCSPLEIMAQPFSILNCGPRSTRLVSQAWLN